MVTAEEALAGAIVVKNESHRSPEKASNFEHEGSTPTTPKKPSEDGYNWRKYGQKNVKRNEYIKSYYKCSYLKCQVKKQVEHAHDGRITDTTYFGEHDHPKPQNNLPVTVPSVSVKVQLTDSRSSTVAKEVVPEDTNKLAIIAHQALPPPSETKDEENKDNKMVLKRRKKSSDDAEPIVDKPFNKSCHVVETVSAVDIVNDGYRWRKYGQKLVKGNQHPRSYYRCSNPGCPAKKHVERAFHDSKVVITSYEGKHIHDIPPIRTILPQGKQSSLRTSSEPNGGKNSNMPDQSEVAQDNTAISEKEKGEEKKDVPTDPSPETGSSEQRTPDNMDVSSCQESNPKEKHKPVYDTVAST